MSETPRDPADEEPTGEISIGRGAGEHAAGPVSGAPASGTPMSGTPMSGTPAGGTPAGGGPTGGGYPAAAGATSGVGATVPGAGTTTPGTGGITPGTGGTTPGAGSGDAAPAGAGRPAVRRRLLNFGPLTAGSADPRQRRRRRWFVWGIAVAAAIVVVALCAGALSVVSAVNGARDRAADARQARALRENDCLDLEKRLNRLVPPGSTTTPAARATAIRDENAAVRIYVDQLDTQRDEDAWRQLLDARTVFADALDRQAKSRIPAFYVAPRTDNGQAVADQLVEWSPAQCAGAIRRLAVPEL